MPQSEATSRSWFLSLLLAFGASGPAAATLPTWEPPELRARANFSGAHNLPDSAFFTNSTVALNDAGQAAIYLSVLNAGADTRGIWMDDGETAGVVYEGPAGAFLSDVSLNENGVVAFPQTDSSQNGIWTYDSTSDTAAFLTSQPLGSSYWGRPEIDDAGRVGWRASFGSDHAYASFDGSPPAAVHAVEASLDPSSPYSFLFTPSTDSSRRIAGKVRLGAAGQVGGDRPDQVRIFESDGKTSTLVAEDADSDPGSTFSSFDNGVTLTDAGWVAFTAGTTGGDRGVFLSDGTTVLTIALESDPEVQEIEFFAPVANALGLVAFRGVDAAGLQAIFVGDGTDLVRVVGEHDLVETDLGTARIDQHDGSPVFGGGIAIDGRGSVAFAAGLTPPDDDQVEWGSGIFVMSVPTAIFADGFESGDLQAWTSSAP